jgi:hypothetical protein
MSAEEDGDPGVSLSLAKMGMAYLDAAFRPFGFVWTRRHWILLAGRCQMYTRQTRMELETVTVRPEGLRMLLEFKNATVTARTKHAAIRTATVPPGHTDDGPAFSQRDQKVQAATEKKKEEAAIARKRELEGAKHQQAPKASKSTQGAAGSAADTSGRGQPAGGQ